MHIYFCKITYLLHLKLDCGFDLDCGFHHHGFRMDQGGWKFVGLVQVRAKQTGDLPDKGLAGQEGNLLLGCKAHKHITNSCDTNKLIQHLTYQDS